MMTVEVFPLRFYEESPEIVAKNLLGKFLFKREDDAFLGGLIVETEAYYGFEDPASRAFGGIKNYNITMQEEPGRVFIYNVHKYWMLNIVAHGPNRIGAVLIRALQPTEGIEIMKRNRPVREITDLTTGPGKLTLALGIDKHLNGVPVTSSESQIFVANNNVKFEIGSSRRIGVKKDLNQNLRFFIKGNEFVSTKRE